jgi:hypothetical protein
MSQTILIETSDDLKKILSINLNTFIGTNVIHRTNAEDTLSLLKILPQISLIITQAKVGDEETALEIHQYLKEKNLSTVLISLMKLNALICLPVGRF